VVAHSDPAEMVETLRRRYTKDVHLVGGPATIATLLDLGAIDRLEVFIVPALFGTGTSLAADPRAQRDLELERHRV